VRRIQDRLLYTREEINLRERDRRMKELVRKEHLASSEILEADFGTKCPNGLDTTFPQLNVTRACLTETEEFQSMSEHERFSYLANISGSAGSDSKINLNPEISAQAEKRWFSKWRRDYSNTIAHEHIHLMQEHERELGWGSMWQNTSAVYLKLPPQDKGVKGWLKHRWQKFAQNRIDKKAQLDAGEIYNVSNYFSRGVEMQARLHEVLVQGYAGWQKMPGSKMELWAALHGLGLNTPPSVLKELKSSPEGFEALETFKSSAHMQKQAAHKIGELNFVDRYAVFKENREVLWRNTYPDLYGNLLENYGDSLGRARMDMGRSPRAALKLLEKFKNGKYGEEWGYSDVNEVLPEHAVPVINSLMIVYPEGTQRSHEAVKLADRLLSRAEVREAVAGQETSTFAGAGNKMPPLHLAIPTGQTSMIACLLKHGVDPLKSGSFETPCGEKEHIRAPLEFFSKQAHAARKALDDPSKFQKKLRTSFEDAESREEYIERLAMLQKGLKAVAENYPHMNQSREISCTGGDTETVTARELLEKSGVLEAKLTKKTGGSHKITRAQ
jgi:hypothetical protein